MTSTAASSSSTAASSSSTALQDRATYGIVPTVLSPADKTATVTRVRCLERETFDDRGKIRRGMSLAAVEELVALINDLRRRLGWLEIDLDGRWRWPEPTSSKAIKGAKRA